MRKFATAMLALNPILWASFYAISKQALRGVTPLAFATLELSIAAIPAAGLILVNHRSVDRDTLRSGALLGLILSGAVIGSTAALAYTTATNTAFFPALNGVIAVLISLVFLGQRIAPRTWASVAVATCGALLLIASSRGGGGDPFGDMIALAAAAIYTVYIFAVDQATNRLRDRRQLWIVAGTEMIVMAALAWIALGLSGSTVGVVSATVVETAIYVGVFTTFLPAVIALLFQRHVRPMTVALLYVLEPVWGAVAAAVLDGERLSGAGYLGGAFILGGAVLSIGRGGTAAADPIAAGAATQEQLGARP